MKEKGLEESEGLGRKCSVLQKVNYSFFCEIGIIKINFLFVIVLCEKSWIEFYYM